MAWCLVKTQGQIYLFTFIILHMVNINVLSEQNPFCSDLLISCIWLAVSPLIQLGIWILQAGSDREPAARGHAILLRFDSFVDSAASMEQNLS
jgi:hypothetical protein